MKQQIENIIKKNLPEKKKIDYSYVNVPEEVEFELSYWENKGFNQALSQINTSLIADEVLKVVVEKIKDYEQKEIKERQELIKNGIYQTPSTIEDIIKFLLTLSPNKENK